MRIPSTSLAIRAASITPYDKSTAVSIATWLLMIVFVIMFLSREAIKFVVLRRFGGDDVLIMLATVFGVGLSATTLVLASRGLGVAGDLTVSRAWSLMKGYYASDFLYIATICFAKLSLVTYFYSIIVQRAQRRAVLGLGIFITVWTTASLIAVAFQCKLPRPWAKMTLNCYNSGFFWIVYCIIDMTSDVAIIMLSVNLVAYLKVKFSRKVVVVACFAPRILVIGAALARLLYLYPITPRDDPEFNLWIPTIITQIQVCLSISTACVPYMKPFFEGLEAGVWRVDDLRRKGVTAHDLYAFGSGSTYRTHKKGKELHSVDSTLVTSLQYGRTLDKSPRIPSPAPLSPLTTPRYNTPESFKGNSRSPSERGLRLQIPEAHLQQRPVTVSESDGTSPKTASSHALSPQMLSPMSPQFLSPLTPRPLLSAPTFSPIRGPTPPPRSHSPRPPIPSSQYSSPNSSPDPNRRSPPRSPNLSLFPSPARSGRYSLTPSTKPRVLKPRTAQRIAANSSQPRNVSPKYPPRVSSMHRSGSGSTRKFAVAPNPANPTPSTTIPSYYSSKSTPRYSQGTEPSSIPSYYLNTPPATNPPTFPVPQPPSPNRQRNQRILAPSNSSRQEQISPLSPPSPRTPLSFWREETPTETAQMHTRTPRSPLRANKPWETDAGMDEMPAVRDIRRSSPRIVIQRSET